MKSKVKPAIKVKSRNFTTRSVSRTKRFAKKTLRDILLSSTFHKTTRALVVGMVFTASITGFYFLIGEKVKGSVIISQSEIVSRVAKHVSLPSSNPDALVRVEDAETLKKENSFYEKVKEGDYVVIYPSLAIIYDVRNDSIVGVKRSGE